MAIPVGLTAQQMLDAMDGVAFVLDTDGVFVAIGNDAWYHFAVVNGAPGLAPNAVIGKSLYSLIGSPEVRDVCRKLHDAVCRGRRPLVSYEYRCDAPGAERRMRMSISPLKDPSGSILALYQSQTIAEAPRLPLGLLSMEQRADPTVTYARDELVVLCSFCHDLAWPIGSTEPDRIWIGIDEYYRRGGSTNVAVSHGICPPCIDRLLTPLN